MIHFQDETPYTREEVLKYGNEKPERGLFCPKCQACIPQFANLNENERQRIQNLTYRQSMLAIAELRAATGCSLLWAKMWVNHHGRQEFDYDSVAPCPFCGEALRTPIAKQCRHCLMDWHDTNNLTKLSAPKSESSI